MTISLSIVRRILAMLSLVIFLNLTDALEKEDKETTILANGSMEVPSISFGDRNIHNQQHTTKNQKIKKNELASMEVTFDLSMVLGRCYISSCKQVFTKCISDGFLTMFIKKP